MKASIENVTLQLFEDKYASVSDEARAEVDIIIREFIAGMKAKGADNFGIMQAKILYYQMWDFLNLEPATRKQLRRQAEYDKFYT